MSDLVGNPEDRFSRVAAHMLVVCSALMTLTETSVRLTHLTSINGAACGSYKITKLGFS